MSFYRQHDRQMKEFAEPSLTKQEFKEECDINNILAPYEKMGVDPLAWVEPLGGTYMDVSSLGTFEETMQVVALGREGFERLPSEVRERFYNDPAVFLDWVGKEENAEEARKMGLLPPAEQDTAAAPAAAVPAPTAVEEAIAKSAEGEVDG